MIIQKNRRATEIGGVDFCPIWGMSGVQGFDGEGYRLHSLWKIMFPCGFTFKRVTFVTKTVTLKSRQGNVRSREIIPRWVCVNFRKGIVLNAMGLPNKGVAGCLNNLGWQERTEPFFLSFASVESDRRKRKDELIAFCDVLGQALWSFSAPVGLQVNKSCPNSGHDPKEFESEIVDDLDVAARLKIPVLVKLNILTLPETAADISKHPALGGFCVTNTIPWGQLPDRINWRGLFESDVSPLARFGGGGLSGAPLLPLVTEWVSRARDAGVEKHINAGGGILNKNDVRLLAAAGANSVSVGSVAILRPWRLQSIISESHQAFG